MTDRKRYPVPRDTGEQHASENFDDQSQRLFGLDIFLDQKNRSDRKHDANGQISQMFPAIYFRQGFSPLLNMLSRSIIILMHEATKHLPFPPHKKNFKNFLNNRLKTIEFFLNLLYTIIAFRKER